MKDCLSEIKTNHDYLNLKKTCLEKKLNQTVNHEEKWEPCKGNRPTDEDTSKI